MPRLSFTFSTASFSMERVLSPRKSILISPVSSITEPSYCVHISFSCVALSSAVLIGTQSDIASRQIIMPQACTPVFLTLPSSITAYFSVLESSGSLEAAASRSSGIAAIAFGRFILGTFPSGPSGSLSGMSLHRRLLVSRGSFCTRATSFSASFVAIVPYVIMCATFSKPYFFVTQLSTSPRPSSSKSTSISGRLMRSGLRKRSKSRSYLMGSICVIPRQYATAEPAAEPRPGPTHTPSSLRAALM